MMEKRVISKNITASLLLQFVTIISGFVLPKIILSFFGSDVNGLISSINQILNYVQLLEGGLSGVVMAALYKPLSENNEQKISQIINATISFFRQIGIIYIVYVAVVGFIYPMLKNTGFDYLYSMGLVWVLGLNLFVQYFFSLSYKILLNADRKVYFVSLTQIIIIIINLIVVCFCAVFFKDILIIKLFSGLVFFIQPILYRKYIKGHYHLDRSAPKDNAALKQRWDGFGINLAYFIHTNTDIVILTVFASLADISIYSVYYMIISALKNLIMSISSSITPSFGKKLAECDRNQIKYLFDKYEFGMSFITTLIFTCGIILVTPFVSVYTNNIEDANYIQYGFGYILGIAEMIYCFREPYIAVSYAAGHFKSVSGFAYVEAILNIAISLFLVKCFGIVGVAVGTMISMIYRMICHVWYLSKNILVRPLSLFFKNIAVFGICSAVGCAVSIHYFNLMVTNYFNWFVVACQCFVFVLILLIIFSFLFYREQFRNLVKMLLDRFGRT